MNWNAVVYQWTADDDNTVFWSDLRNHNRNRKKLMCGLHLLEDDMNVPMEFVIIINIDK